MLKKTIKYTDYNGVEREEDFFFNLTEAELTELELGTTGGFVEMINRITQTIDGPAIMATFKKIILQAYGEKSADGRMFIKKDPVTGIRLSNNFEQTEAYSVLFMECCTDADAASAFINGIVPKPKNSVIPAPEK